MGRIGSASMDVMSDGLTVLSEGVGAEGGNARAVRGRGSNGSAAMDAVSAALTVLSAGRGAPGRELGAAGRGVATDAETATDGRDGAVMRGGLGTAGTDEGAGGAETRGAETRGVVEGDAETIDGTGGAAARADPGGALAASGMGAARAGAAI
jgi:hypothetical protein